jgi:general secretion pathway protein A
MSKTQQPPETHEPFVYSDFEEAKRELLGAVARGPLYGLLIGLSGTGKTSLLREVARALDRHRFQVHYLAQSKTSSGGVARFLCEALHLTPRRSHVQTLSAMAEYLRTLPFRVLVFVDEAQLLAEDTLQELRLLAESELDSPPLFSVLLSGLPELKRKLDTPSLFPLKRRLSLRLELRGLKAEEVAPFLRERFGKLRFSPESVSLLFERARGVPALLEDLARFALERHRDQEPLSREQLGEILEEREI